MSVEISNIDHLGLVAGIIDFIGMEGKINEILGEQRGEKISAGQVVKGMILNGLGLVSSPLYLFSQFFQGKAIEHLIGPGAKAQYFNDDRLGRVLDQLYKRGINEIFVSVALEAVKSYKLEMETVHLDSSSFSVHGEYENPGEELEPKVVNITYGYSRDHRPDLKQFMMELICTGDGDVPLWMKIGEGNESDQKQFAQSMKEFQKQFNLDSLIVADSALYTQENLEALRNIKGLSRVPLKIKDAQNLAQSEDSAELTSSKTQGYTYREVGQTYGGIKQRWLIVESEERLQSDLKQLKKKIEKDFCEAQKALGELTRQRFACIPDAKQAADKLLKKSKYHELKLMKILEVSDKSEGNVSYKVEGKVTASQVKIQPDKKQAGRFILATNVTDKNQLTAEEMLSKYKGQQSVERGFRFLKDPYFLTDSVFLKSPHRIEALGLIMGLCLLIYTLGQRQLRQSLTRTQSTVRNQLGRPTNRPTLRWIFQCFQSIHWFFQSGEAQVSNLTEERLHLLKFFPASSQRYYLLSEIV